MSGKISGFLREYILIFSVIVSVLGFFVIFLGASGIWFQDVSKDVLNFTDDFLKWSPYLLVIGFIILGIGLYYLYGYLKNRKLVLKELKTKKRSELLKRHSELKDAVKHMPSKYKKMLKDKEEELRIR
jgi:hypothetical protein